MSKRDKRARVLTPDAVRPVVVHSNYMTVARGQSWGERVIPDLELILIVAGRFSYNVRGEAAPVLLKAGDVLLIRPGESHTLRREEEPAHAAFSCIHLELLPGARWASGDYRCDPPPRRVTPVDSWAIHDLFMRCSEVFSGYHRYRTALIETLVRELWIRLSECWTGGGPGGGIPERVRPMVSYLRAHLADPRVGRRDLAREFRITPEHVNALFRRALGVTPTQFLHRERILKAYRLLRDDGCSVKEAAAQVGFDDPFYFSRVFKRVLKRPPSAWRRGASDSHYGRCRLKGGTTNAAETA